MKGSLGIAKNYQELPRTTKNCQELPRTIFTSIAAKIYNALQLNCIEPEIEKILWKNQNGFQRNWSTTSQILTIRQILEGVCAKNLQTTLLFVDFSKAFNSIHRGKMEQILLAYSHPRETITAIIIIMLCYQHGYPWPPLNHPSLSSIASGRSSGLHPISALSCCM